MDQLPKEFLDSKNNEKWLIDMLARQQEGNAMSIGPSDLRGQVQQYNIRKCSNEYLSFWQQNLYTNPTPIPQIITEPSIYLRGFATDKNEFLLILQIAGLFTSFPS